jgi:hypothetical protein
VSVATTQRILAGIALVRIGAALSAMLAGISEASSQQRPISAI